VGHGRSLRALSGRRAVTGTSPVDPGSDQAPAPARGALGAIGRHARAANLSRAYEIQATLTRAAAGGAVSEASRQAASRAAHQIAGSAGTFGMAAASSSAQELEHLLQHADLRDEASLMEVIASLDALLTAMTGEPPSGTEPAHHAPEDPGVTRPSMLIAVPDAALAARVTGSARARGWDTRWTTDVRSTTAELRASAPDVVLLDLDLPPQGTAVLTLAATHEPPVPTVVLLTGDDVLDRVEAARAGATSFASASMEPDRLVAALTETLSRPDGRRRRVLAVDDDPVILDYLREVLADTSLDVTTVADPLRFWEKLKETQPDLVLLDVDMPGLTGVELCRLIRTDARWAELPVLVLTGTVHPTNVTTLFAAGADDYVAKPVVGPELLARIHNRLDRVQLHKRMAETDPLTGLRNRAAFEAAFHDLTTLAGVWGQPLSVAMIDLDGFRSINTEHGYAVGDEVVLRLAAVLDATFHGDDVVARWSGTELAVAMLGLDRSDGVARVADVLEAFRGETVAGARGLPVRATFSAAVGEHGDDGTDLYDLMRALGRAMAIAKERGGDQVLPVGWSAPRSDEVADVVHLGGDDAFAALLHRALRTRGLRAVHLADGRDGVRRLVGPDGVRARVVVLDDAAPRLDALDALARLGSGGVLDRSRVIVVSDRTGGDDAAQAQALGAFDHLPTPVDPAVLVQRIRRALAG
jgi:diguanylate cyclase (GGDEF)-like protein